MINEDPDVHTRFMDFARVDKFAKLIGIECIDARLGGAVARMKVRQDHLNFLGGCHGGAIFALADQAFGLASNSHNTIAVGIDTHMAFVNGAAEGDVLTATAKEVSCGNRTAVYYIEVTREDGKTLATFTGTVFRTGKPLTDAMMDR